MNMLPSDQQETLILRYWQDQTLREIAKAKNTYAKGVRRQELKALKQLRMAPGLEQFIEDRTPYYHHIGISAFNTIWTSAVEMAAIKRETIRKAMAQSGKGAMDKSAYCIDAIIQETVDADHLTATRQPKDSYRATERRLFSLPLLLIKQADDLAQIQKLQQERHNMDATELAAEIDRDRKEIATIEKALAAIKCDKYYQVIIGRYIEGRSDGEIAAAIRCDLTTVWRNRKRLVQRLAVRLYGTTASA